MWNYKIKWKYNNMLNYKVIKNFCWFTNNNQTIYLYILNTTDGYDNIDIIIPSLQTSVF